MTLVGALVPLAAGIYWKRANAAGALTSILMGLTSWLLMEFYGADSIWPAQLVGLAFAVIGMVAGSLASRAPAHHAKTDLAR